LTHPNTDRKRYQDGSEFNVKVGQFYLTIYTAVREKRQMHTFPRRRLSHKKPAEMIQYDPYTKNKTVKLDFPVFLSFILHPSPHIQKFLFYQAGKPRRLLNRHVIDNR
jgi:hypothetical protein